MTEGYFKQLETQIRNSKNVCVVVPMAADQGLAFAIKESLSKGFVGKAILIGEPNEIKALFQETPFSDKIEIIASEAEIDAVDKAITLIKNSKANILMRGMVHPTTFIDAVSNPISGLPHSFLSNIAFFQLSGKQSPQLLTDSSVHLSPNEDCIYKEIENAIACYKEFSDKKPKVALLAANEKVSDKVISTKAAKIVADRFADSEYIVEGPVSFDLAVCKKSAQIKKYKGQIQGDADLFIAPRGETANVLYKSLEKITKTEIGSLVYGADCPIISPSRRDSDKTKYNSLLLGLFLLNKRLSRE